MLVLLLASGGVGCGHQPAPKATSTPVPGGGPARISEADVQAYVDWHNEFWATVRREGQQGSQVLEGRGEQAYYEQVKSARAKVSALEAKKPFRGTIKGEALDKLQECFFISGRYFRDEKQLQRLQERYGSLIETGAAHEFAWKRLEMPPP